MSKYRIFVIFLIIIFCLSFFMIIGRVAEKFKLKLSPEKSITQEANIEYDMPSAVTGTNEGSSSLVKKTNFEQEQIETEREDKEEAVDELTFEQRRKGALRLNQLAQELEKIRDYEGATEKYKQAIKLDPDFDVTYNNLGDLYYKKGHYALAIENFKKALTINKRAAYYNNLGNVYYKEGKFSKAILEYEKALRLEPEAAYIYNNLGDAYLKKGSVLIATKYLKKAVELKPDFILAYRNLTQALMLKGKYGEVETLLRQAISYNRDEIAFYIELANVYERQRKYEEELDLLKEFLIFEPDNRSVQLKIKNLERMIQR